MKSIFLLACAVSTALITTGCVTRVVSAPPNGPSGYGYYPPQPNYPNYPPRSRGGYETMDGYAEAGGYRQSGGGQVNEWGKASSAGRGEKGGCHVKVGITYKPSGWITPEESQTFYNFLKYTICAQLAPADVKKEMEVHKPPSFVTDLSQFEGIGSKGTYTLADGKRTVVWFPDTRPDNQ